jgi:sugar phosphate isomerase/epimerase
VGNELTRRELIARTPALAAATAAGCLPSGHLEASDTAPAEPFGYCLNTSTISGQKLDLVEVIEIAAKAGYRAIEPWIREIDQYVKTGRSLKELGKRIQDRGLHVESVIGFFEWIVDDDQRRAKGLEEARRNMDLVQQIGGKRLAAPPVGATKQTDLNLHRAAERYRVLLELGAKMGVVPQVELWGHSQSLSRLGEVALVAIESGHSQACILADVYHLYKGGSNLNGLGLLGPASMYVLHFNDYPAQPSRADITDAQRVYPGDGVAPLKDILRTLRRIGFRGVLSLELFNRGYWQQDALTVARTGREKMQRIVRASLE